LSSWPECYHHDDARSSAPAVIWRRRLPAVFSVGICISDGRAGIPCSRDFRGDLCGVSKGTGQPGGCRYGVGSGHNGADGVLVCVAPSASKISAVADMKIIFLDIDGVLNCDKTPNPRKFPYVVDKKLLLRLYGFSNGPRRR
jgi:hypothetical protein